VIPQGDRPARAVALDVAEAAPGNPLEARVVDGLEVSDFQVELQHHIREVVVRQVLEVVVLVPVVPIPEDQNGEVARGDEVPGHGESAVAGPVEGRRCAAPVETTQMHGPVRPEFLDELYGHKSSLFGFLGKRWRIFERVGRPGYRFTPDAQGSPAPAPAGYEGFL